MKSNKFYIKSTFIPICHQGSQWLWVLSLSLSLTSCDEFIPWVSLGSEGLMGGSLQWHRNAYSFPLSEWWTTLFLPRNNNSNNQKKEKGGWPDRNLYVQQWSGGDSWRPDIRCDTSLRLIGQDRYGWGVTLTTSPSNHSRQAGTERCGKVIWFRLHRLVTVRHASGKPHLKEMGLYI